MYLMFVWAFAWNLRSSSHFGSIESEEWIMRAQFNKTCANLNHFLQSHGWCFLSQWSLWCWWPQWCTWMGTNTGIWCTFFFFFLRLGFFRFLHPPSHPSSCQPPHPPPSPAWWPQDDPPLQPPPHLCPPDPACITMSCPFFFFLPESLSTTEFELHLPPATFCITTVLWSLMRFLAPVHHISMANHSKAHASLAWPTFTRMFKKTSYKRE